MSTKKLIIAGLLASVAAFASVTIPYVHTPNTPITSSKENANNQALATEINAHEAVTTNVHGSTGALIDVGSNQTVTGQKTFSGKPLFPNGFQKSSTTGPIISVPTLSTNDTLVTNESASTLTNKSMDGLQNTFTNIPASALPTTGMYSDSAATITGIYTYSTPPVIPDFSTSLHNHSNAAGGGTIDHTDLTSIGTATHSDIDNHIAASTAHGVSGSIVGTSDTQTLSNKTLTAPTIGNFTNAGHAHSSAATGGTVDHTSLSSIGTNTHADIDTHIGLTSSFHGTTVSAANIDDAVGKRHTQGTDTGSTSNSFAIGDGTDSSKTITATTTDVNKPALRWNDTTSKWQYSNDGVVFADIGSGGGGGGITKYANLAAFPTCDGTTDGDIGIALDSDTVYECNATAWNLIASRTTVTAASGPLSIALNSMSITQADATHDGYLTQGDWGTFNSKEPAVTKGNLSTTTTGVTVGSGTGAVIGSGTTINIDTADSTHTGLLSSTDWSTFNGKAPATSGTAILKGNGSGGFSSASAGTDYEAAQTKGSISTTTAGLTIGSGSNSTVGPNVTVDVAAATQSTQGLMSAADKTKLDYYANSENLIVNQNAENTANVAGDTWTCTNATVLYDTGTYASPTRSWKITATAAGGYCTAAFTTLTGRVNHDSYFYYKTTASDVVLGAYLGANLQNSATLAAKSAMSESSHVTFITDGTATAGTIRVTMPTNGTVIYVDDLYAGANQNIGSVAQAEFVGSIEWAPTTDCFWQNTTVSPAVGTFSAVAKCDDNTITYSGNAIADASNPGQLPQIRVRNGKAGRYVVTAKRAYFFSRTSTTTIGVSYFGFSDGTTSKADSSVYSGTFSSGNYITSTPYVISEFTYDAGFSEKTFSVYGGTSNNLTIINAVDTGLVISVYYYPTSSQTAVRVGTEAVSWMGYHGPDCSWSKSGATLGSFGADASCTFTERSKQGEISVAAHPGYSAGIDVTLAKARRLRVCASPTVDSNTATYNFQIAVVQGSSTGQIVSGNGNYRNTLKSCVDFDTPTGTTLFEVVGGAETGSTVQIDPYPTYGHAIEWEIIDITNPIPQPVIVNSVTHTDKTQWWRVRGTVNTNGGALHAGSGDWSASEVSTARYQVTFAIPFTSTDYTCGCTAGEVARFCSLREDAQPRTASIAEFATFDDTGTLNSSSFDFWCEGIR